MGNTLALRGNPGPIQMPTDRHSNSRRPPQSLLGPDDLQWLQRLARRLTGNPQEADDLVQETWMVAQKELSDRAKPNRAWLSGVLRNKNLMLRRSEGRRRRRETRFAERDSTVGPDLERQQGIVAILHDALGKLDETDRELLLMRYAKEYKAPELGRKFGMPAPAVRKRLSEATAKMRKILDERCSGDRQAWAPAVLAFSQPPPSAGLAVGGRALGWTIVVTSAVALVSLLAALGWWLATGSWETKAPDSETLGEVEGRDSDALAARRRNERRSIERTPATLTGHVIESGTSQPIAGALVLANLQSPNAPVIGPRAFTGPDGSFTIGGLPAGRYSISAAVLGRLPAKQGEVEVRPGVTKNGIVLRLTPGGNRVDGTVVDISGGPVEGGLVQAIDARSDDTMERVVYGTITDAEGAYSLTLPDGGWIVEAGGEDYSPRRQKMKLSRGPGHADFVLTPGAEIHGQVVTRSTGSPVVGAMVGYVRKWRLGTTYGNENAREQQFVTTDDRGRFVLRPLESAIYSLYATAPGFAAAAYVDVHAAIGEEVRGAVILMDTAFDASGFVVEKGNHASGIGGVTISVRSDSHLHYFVMTEPDGYFSIPGLLAGDHRLRLMSNGVLMNGSRTLHVSVSDRSDVVLEVDRGFTVKGRVNRAIGGTVGVSDHPRLGGFDPTKHYLQDRSTIDEDGTFEIEGASAGSWKVVALGEDGSRGELEIEVHDHDLDGAIVKLEAQPRVGGVVVDTDGEPLAGMTVRLEVKLNPKLMSNFFKSSKVYGSAVTAATGAFEIQGIMPGHYDVVVVDGHNQPASLVNEDTSSIDVGGREDVDDLELEVALANGMVRGVVLDPDGNPIPDAWVGIAAKELGFDEPRPPPAITNDEGRFVFTGLADRAYVVSARGPDANAQVSVDHVWVGSNVELELQALAAIHGRVTRNGEPVTHFEIFAKEDLADKRTVLSDDGTFVLERVWPGKSRVAVCNDTGAASASLELEPGEPTSIELELAEWGSLEGVVVSDTDGLPLADARVHVHSESGIKTANDCDFWRFDVQTDPQGHFIADGIGHGRGYVVFSIESPIEGQRGSEKLGHRAFVLAPGQHLDLGHVITLEPAKIPLGEHGTLGLEVNIQDEAWMQGPTGNPLPLAVRGTEVDSPAMKAGLREGDHIFSFDGIVASERGTVNVYDAMEPHRIRAGQGYTVEFERGSSRRTVRIVADPVSQ